MNVPKNPVSILQEMMVKKRMAPNYELIEGGTGHIVSFTYRVTCDGFTATGTGRCKKDAKHEAASAMLATIAKHQGLPQLPASQSESPVRTPLPMTLPVCPKSPANVPFCNAIGKLQELCMTNNLHDPEYKETGDVGPPHARVFTVQCRVSTFVEEGTATTKKQAKHEAARKMVERINSVVSDDPTLAPVDNENRKREQISSKMAMERYPALSIANTEIVKSKINWGLLVKNFHKRLKSNYEEDARISLIGVLDNLLSLMMNYAHSLNKDNLAEIKEEFDKILNTMDVQYQRNSYTVDETVISQINKVNFIVGIQLNTIPDIHEISVSSTEVGAEFQALLRVVKSIKFFLE